MKNVLNYFVRKAFGFKSTATAEDKTLFGHLLRIKRNIQGVYDWLYARCPADAWWLARRMPMTEAVTSADGSSGSTPVKIRPVLQNSDNLLAHLRLLDGRKISNGYQDGTPADDGLPDGVSLARILCDSTTQPTALIDDNIGWVMDKQISTTFDKVVLGCKSINIPITDVRSGAVKATGEVRFDNLESFFAGDYDSFLLHGGSGEELVFPKLQSAINGRPYGHIIANCNYKRIIFQELVTYREGNHHYGKTEGIVINSNGVEYIECTKLPKGGANANINLFYNLPNLEELILPSFTDRNTNIVRCCPNLKKLVLGKITAWSTRKRGDWAAGEDEFEQEVNLLHLEIGEGSCASINLGTWSPTLDSSNLSLFLSNFLHFIAERVAEGNYTLTLSAAVYAALEQQEGQTILALLNTKGWTVASA